jgi:hypothetical protein
MPSNLLALLEVVVLEEPLPFYSKFSSEQKGVAESSGKILQSKTGQCRKKWGLDHAICTQNSRVAKIACICRAEAQHKVCGKFSSAYFEAQLYTLKNILILLASMYAVGIFVGIQASTRSEPTRP